MRTFAVRGPGVSRDLGRHLCLLAFLAIFLSTAEFAFSQISGDVRGSVIDPSGVRIANAHVDLTQSSTNIRRDTVTSDAGEFRFTQLNPGSYQLDVIAIGFQRLSRTGVTVAVGQTVNLDLQLTVGSDQQNVTVNSDAPLLQTLSSNIQTNIAGTTAIALPLNTRNFVQLTTLAPGVELPPGTLLPRINGGRPRTNEYLFDGISALQPEPGQVVYFPIADDIQEFTVEANNVSAEFGRFNGGVVNIATRSGTNAFHGTLLEFFRNEDLNARNYFSRPPTSKPEYRRNLYGATMGGPILRNRLFAFGAYQGVEQLIGVTRTSTVPTMDEKHGIFTGISHIYNPLTTRLVDGKYVRDEFPEDIINIPFDAAASSLLARYPTPTDLNAKANNYTRTENDSDHQNQFDVRIDGVYKTRDHLFGRYSYFGDDELPVTPLPDGSGAISGSVLGTGNVAGVSSVLGQQAVIGETHTFSVRLLNDLRLGYTRRGNSVAGATLDATASDALGIPGIPTNAAFNNALPLFSLTGFQQLGPSASTFSQYQTAVWEMLDSFDITMGRHAFKAGLDFRWYQLNTVSPPYPHGRFRIYRHRNESTRCHQQWQCARQLSTGPGRHFSD